MTGRHNLLAFMLFCLCVNQPAMAAAETDATCSAQREHISQQIKDARLKGDSGQRVLLEAQLQNLTERCSGVVPLQPNHAEIERAMRLATTREAQLREAQAGVVDIVRTAPLSAPSCAYRTVWFIVSSCTDYISWTTCIVVITYRDFNIVLRIVAIYWK